MRELTEHIVSGDQAVQLKITVMDEPGSGGANHDYVISKPGLDLCRIQFQNGPIRESGVNGITQEALLAIVIDRLRGFQRGPYACAANEKALNCCKDALMSLQERTVRRIERGVEGTLQK